MLISRLERLLAAKPVAKRLYCYVVPLKTMRNVEIKARARDHENLLKRAAELSGTDGEIIEQHDTFYKVNEGRLKLRRFKDNSSSLVYYDRPDCEGPKLSDYEKCDFPSEITDKFHQVMAKALGTTVDVVKVRKLFMVGATRIHVDTVKDLGNFVELEVVLRPEQSVEEGQKIAETIMAQLGIEASDLISGAYADLLK